MPTSLKYFVLRSINAVVVLFIVVLIIAFLYSNMADEMARGIVADELRGYSLGLDPDLSDEEREHLVNQEKDRLENIYGLNDPFLEKVTRRTWNTFTFNLGQSTTRHYYQAEDAYVTTIILMYLPRTILLFTTAACISIILGIGMGLKAAQVAGTKLDKALSIFGIVTASLPMWWVGMLAILLFGFQLGWFPASSFPFPTEEGWPYYTGVLRRMIMPLGTIVFVSVGGRAWATRNMVTSVLQDDYIMAARAKGIPERKVIYGHTLKTAAPPILTSAILSFLLSIGGAMITEVIYNWPGMGYLLRTAIFAESDMPVIMGIVYITTVLWVVGYLIADLLYGFLDPRVEVGAEKKV